MGRRNKTTFEKWFSVSRHKRRSGSKELSKSINEDFHRQKNHVISGDTVHYTHGSNNDIESHFNALKEEFIGKSELCYTHAKIIVFIRREYQINKYFPLFEKLWGSEKKHLLENLNTRWLVAAADTFADHSSNNEIKASAIACSCLVNTVKLQETERYITNISTIKDNSEKVNFLQDNNRLALFDGTSGFAVGTDDTLRNMRWRIDAISSENICGEILLEIFNRLQVHDTVYSRFKKRHTRKKTGWW